MLAAPRPLRARAVTEYHLGVLNGTRHYRDLGNAYYYRQGRRRRQLPRQFHGSDTIGTFYAPFAARPQPCAFCGQLNPKGLRTDICTICLDYYVRHGLMLPEWERPAALPAPAVPVKPHWLTRARYARPLRSDPMTMLRDSRMRPAALRSATRCLFVALRPRRRSRFALTAGTLHYLACRRLTAAQCQRMGMQRLRPGVWYDDLADVLYAQCVATDDWGL